jgi:rubrerythrin
MLPYNKHWLEHEMHLIEAQTKKDKRQKKDTEIMCGWLLCISVFFVSVASAHDVFICRSCIPSSRQMQAIEDVNGHNLEVKKGTWRCPNPKCRYINDNRIRYCPLCGSERQ